MSLKVDANLTWLVLKLLNIRALLERITNCNRCDILLSPTRRCSLFRQCEEIRLNCVQLPLCFHFGGFVYEPPNAAGAQKSLHCSCRKAPMRNKRVNSYSQSLGNINEKDIGNITIKNCTFIGTSNRVRIKTWPSAPAELTISGLYFEDLIMRNASNPVVIDQQYCPYNLCSLDKPSLIQIRDMTVKNVVGTTNSAEPILLSCSGSKPCENVEIGDVDLQFTGVSPQNPGINAMGSIGINAAAPVTSKCSNVKPIITGKHNVPICSNAAR